MPIEMPIIDRLSIYVTHGSVLALALIAKKFLTEKAETQVVARCTEKREYIIQVKHCSSVVNECLKQELGFEQLPDEYLYTNLDEFIQFVQRIRKPVYRVCCDVNLTIIAGNVLSHEAHLLLKKTKAYQVFFIHSTPACISNVEDYLRGDMLNCQKKHIFRLPFSVRQGSIMNRADKISDLIQNTLHETETWTTEHRERVAANIIVCHSRYFMFKKIHDKNQFNQLPKNPVKKNSISITFRLFSAKNEILPLTVDETAIDDLEVIKIKPKGCEPKKRMVSVPACVLT